MKAAVIVFPGSNCDRDVAVALAGSTGETPAMVWHGDSELPELDLIVVPGGFAYGDYLRAGAMAAHSPVMREVASHARAGVPTLGICNGFQVLTEAGLLPGVLMANAGLKFICRDVHLRIEVTDSVFTGRYARGQVIRLPIAHHGRQLLRRRRHPGAPAGRRPGSGALLLGRRRPRRHRQFQRQPRQHRRHPQP